ncbi:MAG: gamma-glutamyl-gamma-aminobutyrate hydrolase family protein [Halanaerobiales bacterium]|nr:gamma-glutamyl-gamma-aminobutyrate hydrolase family protein [Halanaerobiales bacterium]
MVRPKILVSSFLREGYKLGKNFEMLSDFDYGMVSQNYVNAVLEAGGLPIVSPQIRKTYKDNTLMGELVDTVDGILLTGGYDIDPENYDKYSYKKIKFLDGIRDKQELKLIELALKKDKAILGICRGFQLLNIYFGGDIYQDIKQDLETEYLHFGGRFPKCKKIHPVSIEKDSILSSIFNQDLIEVNSFHHQAVRKLGDNLIKTAYSPDGLIEGFESTKYENVWAVQWHPEIMFSYYPEQLLIFKEFLNKIKNKRSDQS